MCCSARTGGPTHPTAPVAHFTRGLTDPVDVVEVGAIPTLSVAATLTLLAPAVGIGTTAKALDSALRSGSAIDDLRIVARRWQRRGRAGPGTLLRLLDEREGRTLPRSTRLISGRQLGRGQASMGASISSAADHGSTVPATTASVSSSQRWRLATDLARSRSRWATISRSSSRVRNVRRSSS
jgi:hypothetical protein